MPVREKVRVCPGVRLQLTLRELVMDGEAVTEVWE